MYFYEPSTNLSLHTIDVMNFAIAMAAKMGQSGVLPSLNHPQWGKQLSEETKHRISESTRAGGGGRGVAVKKSDLKMGEIFHHVPFELVQPGLESFLV